MKKLYFVIGLLCLSGCTPNSGGSSRPVSVKGQSDPVTKQSLPPSIPSKQYSASDDPKLARAYSIIKVKDFSLKAMTKPLSAYSLDAIRKLPMYMSKTYRIAVPKDIKIVQIKPTIEKIISTIINKDKNVDKIILFLYSDKDLVDGAYDVATATWAPNGVSGNITPEIVRNHDRSNYKIVIEVSPYREAYFKNKSDHTKKLGLSVKQRQKIYKELIACQDRATAEANAKYNMDGSNYDKNFDKNVEMQRELEKKYRTQLARKLHIPVKRLGLIATEAFKKNWPMGVNQYAKSP